ELKNSSNNADVSSNNTDITSHTRFSDTVIEVAAKTFKANSLLLCAHSEIFDLYQAAIKLELDEIL
ncbi:15887_t:CDS:2, partial [Racocetra persica]